MAQLSKVYFSTVKLLRRLSLSILYFCLLNALLHQPESPPDSRLVAEYAIPVTRQNGS